MSAKLARGRAVMPGTAAVVRSRGRPWLPILALIVALLLSACEFRIRADLMIEADESGTLSVEMSMDEELAALAGGDFGGELAIGEEMVPSGWTAEVLSDGGYEGIRASTNFGSLAELQQRLGEFAEGTGTADTPLLAFLADISPTRDEDTFRFSLLIPEEVEGMIGEGLQQSPIPIDLAVLDEVFDIRLSLVLPGDILSNNADLVSGQTLAWEISLTDSGRVLEAESQLPGPDRTMWIAVGAVVLALLVVVYLVLKLRRRRRIPDPDPVGST